MGREQPLPDDVGYGAVLLALHGDFHPHGLRGVAAKPQGQEDTRDVGLLPAGEEAGEEQRDPPGSPETHRGVGRRRRTV